MPIDPSIVLGLKPAPVIDVQGALARAAQTRNLLSESDYREEEIQNSRQDRKRKEQQYLEADRELAAQKAEGELMAAHTGQDGAVNHSAVVQGLAQLGHGKQASTYLTRVQIPDEKARLENQKNKTENAAKTIALIGQTAQSIADVPDEQLPAEYDRTRQQLIEQGVVKPEDLPPAVDVMAKGGVAGLRQVVKQHGQQAIAANDQIQAKQKELDYQLNLKDRQADWAAKAPETAQKWVNQTAQLLKEAQSPDQWDSTIKAAVTAGAPWSIVKLFGDFGPDAPQRASQLGMTPGQRADAKIQTARLENDARQFALEQDRFLETQRHNRAEEGNAAARLSTDREANKILTPIEAATLQVPYGTTRAQAAGKMPSTQAQNVVAAYASRIAQSSEEIERLGKELGTGERVYNFLTPNFFNTSTGQQFDQAQRDFINAVLRRESGAVISKSEFENAYKQYIPRAGDSPEVLKQKADNRAIQFAAFKRAAGNAYQDPKDILGETNKPAAGGAKYKAGDTRTVNGVAYVRDDKGNWNPK